MPGFKKQFQIGNPALQSNKNISKVKFAIFTVPGSDTVAAFMQPPKQRTIFFETRKYSN